MAKNMTGSIGQIQGPFSPNEDVATIIGKKEYGEDEYGRTITSFYAKIGITINEKDSMIFKTHDIPAAFIPEIFSSLEDLEMAYPWGYLPKEGEAAYKEGWIAVVQAEDSEEKKYYVCDYSIKKYQEGTGREIKEWYEISEEEALANFNFNYKSFPVHINRGYSSTGEEALIWMGWSDMYESDETPIKLHNMYFPKGAPASVLIDYVIMED